MAKLKRAYVLYGTESYIDILTTCARSIRNVSNIPILVYLINSDKRIDINNVQTISWPMKLSDDNLYDKEKDGNFYIKREKEDIYKILVERIVIIRNALMNLADVVTYIDSDSVATENIDRVFDYYKGDPYPLATEGIYDWMFYNGRGACETREDMTGTTEYPACQLFNVDQSVRDTYRTTNLFVAGMPALRFLMDWGMMAHHPKVLEDRELYAPYHEETLFNVLLWKRKYLDGLPYTYMNASVDELRKIYSNEIKFKGHPYFLGEWKRVPARREELLVIHGEKRVDKMNQMIEIINPRMKSKTRLLYLAPHLSTGGMPAFLLKRIEMLNTVYDIYVVEYANWSDEYVVHKNQIKALVNDKFYTLDTDKMELMNIIRKNRIDIVHVEEMVEDSGNAFPAELLRELYRNNRTWRIVETCHNIVFKPDEEKIYHPDAYALCTPYHLLTFKNMPSDKMVIQYPIEKKDMLKRNKMLAKKKLGLDPAKKHVINVGLWTPGKNQAEGLEIARQFTDGDVEFHFIGNQADNFREYWEPLMKKIPFNVRVWGERKDINLFMCAADAFMFNSTWECNPIVLREAIGYGLPILARNLPQYNGMFLNQITPLASNVKESAERLRGCLWKNVVKYRLYSDQLPKAFLENHIDLYEGVLKTPPRRQEPDIMIHFVNGPFVEVKSASASDFRIRFFDENNICLYDQTIKPYHWVRVNREWFTKWRILIEEDGESIVDETLSYEGHRVYIALDSKSLGDSIAWIPYALEFKKKHNCHVIVSTFWNKLFKNAYPELEFVEPGSVVNNLYGMYCIGWFYDPKKEPVAPHTIPLQKAACNILGLEYREIRTMIDHVQKPTGRRPYIAIATNSTAGCKFWTKEGWQGVINWLVKAKGYDVINVSLETNEFENCTQLEDRSIENTMDTIAGAELFIGLSSGLSWLAWALGKKVVMISNFSEESHEFNCIRVVKKDVCHGCWNNPKYKFDKSWNWCPVNKDTPDQFICQTSITAKDVIEKLKDAEL